MNKETIRNEIKMKTYVVKMRIDEFKCKAVNFWNENKAEIVIVAPIVYGGIKATTSTIKRGIDAKKEKDHRDRHIYDRSTGQYYETRRKLTTNERLELERRLANGEKKGQILKSMGVLKL